MSNAIKFTAALLALTFTSFTLTAQSSDEPGIQKDENIVIHKKGSDNEKLTIIVDGDKVTVNGKPLSEFESSDNNVEIITDNPRSFSSDEMPPLPPMPGMIDHGGLQMYGGNIAPINKAFLGVMSEKTDDGVKIMNITKGSPADKAGLQKDDIITKAGNALVANPDDLYKAIGGYNPGDKVNIIYMRDGKSNTAVVSLDKNNPPNSMMNRHYQYEMPTPNLHNFSYNWNNNTKPHMGLQVQDTENGNGVEITDINDEDAPAAKAGLKEGDIITSINGSSVKSVDDLKTTIKSAKEGDTISVKFLRAGNEQSTLVKFPKELKSADL